MNELDKRFWGTIAAVARIYLFGYNLTNPNGGMGGVAQDIANSLPQLIKSINEIQNNITQINDSINNLDEKIRGVISENSIKKAMSEATSRSNQLARYMKDETAIKLNVNDIIRVSGELEVQMDLILSDSNSMNGEISGMFLTAPFMSTWAKALTYGMRQRYIDGGVDPALAPNAFKDPKTKTALKFSKNLISNYQVDFTKYSPYKGRLNIYDIPVSDKLFRFDPNVGFSKENSIVYWPTPGSDLDEVRRQVNERADTKYNHLFWAVKRSLRSGKTSYVCMTSHYVDSYGMKGHLFSRIINHTAPHTFDKIALEHSINVDKAAIFFAQTGEFFNGFSEFVDAINIIENSSWDHKSSPQKYVALCDKHQWEGKIHKNLNDAENELIAHKKLFNDIDENYTNIFVVE